MAEKTMETKVGIINFAEKDVLTEGIEMYFTIDKLSEEWEEIVAQSINKVKAEWDKNFFEERGIGWSDKGVDIDYMTLGVSLDEKNTTYKVVVGFFDKEDKNLYDDICVEVDLSEYEAELKEEIKKALLEKFF